MTCKYLWKRQKKMKNKKKRKSKKKTSYRKDNYLNLCQKRKKVHKERKDSTSSRDDPDAKIFILLNFY